MEAATEPHCRYKEETSSWNETALDWLRRCQQVDADAAVPSDPTSAAWAFVRAKKSFGTGISFMDAVLSKNTENLSIVELRGDDGVGKTWTLISLAARFVVSTRASKFQSTSNDLPQVIFMDSVQSLKMRHISSAVRTELLRDLDDDKANDQGSFQGEVDSALRRVVLVFGEGATSWVPILESLRHLLAGKPFPTLILWDGFLTDVHAIKGRMEVIRQVNRLSKDTVVQLITTGISNRFFPAWDKCIDHRVRLQQLKADTLDQNQFMATTRQPAGQFTYTITGGGILT